MVDINLFKALTWANLKSRYRNTFLGFVWVIMNPILILFVQAFLFSVVFKIQHQNYFVFLMAGLLPWLFIVQSVEMCTGIFVSHANIIKNVPISPLELLITQIGDNFFNFIVSFFGVTLFFYIRGNIGLLNIFLYLLPILLLFISVASLVIILATMNVLYRDLKFVASFVFSLLFYLTPIFYPARYIPSEYKYVLDLNAFFYLLKPFQILANDFELNFLLVSLMNSMLVTLLMSGFAFLIWKKYRRFIVIYG